MNIIFIPPSYLPIIGGVEIGLDKLAKELVKKGHKIKIITLRYPRNLSTHEIINGISVERFSLPPCLILLRNNFVRIGCFLLVTPFMVFKLWRLIKKDPSHMIHIYCTGLNAHYVWILSYFYNFRFLVTLQSFRFKRDPFFPLKRNWIFDKTLRNADYIISCSKSVLDDVLEYIPEIKNKSVVIPNGIDPDDFKVTETYVNNKPYIFSLGRFRSGQKGFDILIMAFRTVIDNGYDVELILAGDGPDRKAHQNLVKLLKLEDRVKFFGNADRDNVARLLNGCEFFVLASRIEPFGIVNLEAMAAGKAVVATNIDGIPEVVKDGINGILVEANNDRALSEAMIKLLKDSKLKNMLGNNGKRMVTDYLCSDIADRYLEIYKKVLNN